MNTRTMMSSPILFKSGKARDKNMSSLDVLRTPVELVWCSP